MDGATLKYKWQMFVKYASHENTALQYIKKKILECKLRLIDSYMSN